MSLSDADIDTANGPSWREQDERKLLREYNSYLASQAFDVPVDDSAATIMYPPNDGDVTAFLVTRKQRLQGGDKC